MMRNISLALLAVTVLSMDVSADDIDLSDTSIDDQSPSPISELSAELISSSVIKVEWEEPSDNVGVIGYNVYRDGAYYETVFDTEFLDSDISLNHRYRYGIVAFDRALNFNSIDTEVFVTTDGFELDTQSPSTVMGVAANPHAEASILVTWEESSDNVGVLGYNVYRDGNYHSTVFEIEFIDSSVSAFSEHRYGVVAFDEALNFSRLSIEDTASMELSLVDDEAPSVVVGVVAEAFSENSINVAWDMPNDNVGVAGYDIYRDGIYHATVFDTQYVDGQVSPDEEYLYGIVAFDQARNYNRVGIEVLASTRSFLQLQNAGPDNVILIMLDDADFYDFGFANVGGIASDALTPNIDRLRHNGLLFDRYYAGSAICSPTRASILTGDMPIKHGVLGAWPQITRVVNTNIGSNGLASDIPQLGQLMRSAGKKTAHHGKWHVGLSRPEFGHSQLGFDQFSYYELTDTSTFEDWSGEYQFTSETGSTVEDVDFIDSYFNDRVLESIEEFHSSKSNFYINYWPLTPHFPWAEPRGYDNSETGFDLLSERGLMLSMMNQIDFEIGRIVSALEEKEILDDTLILITSDNGGPQRVQLPSGRLRGGKGSFFEGGIRVPMIAHWPNGISANSTNSSVMTSYDLMPTLLELFGESTAGIYLQGIDGRSKSEAFLDDTIELEHEDILFELSGHPNRSNGEVEARTFALVSGDYKLIKAEGRDEFSSDTAYFLFDVRNDPFEDNNLRALEPELFSSMRDSMLSLRKSQSKLDFVPEQTTGNKVTVPFDPRFDINKREMTLSLGLEVSVAGVDRILIQRPGAYTLSMLKDGSIAWQIDGVDIQNRGVAHVLSSNPLSPGEHIIHAVVGGYKSDTSTVELYIDGELVDRDDSSLYAINSTVTDLVVGSEGVFLSEIEYHGIRLFSDEF